MARPRRHLVVSPDGQVEVGDLATLRIIADPLRLELLTLLGEPKTARDAAGALGVPTTRLYYHLRLLEEHGLVKVVSTRKVSGIEEKTYQSLGISWTLAPDLTASAIESSGVLTSILDLVQAELSITMRQDLEGHIGDPGSTVPLMTLTRLAFDDAELADFQARFYKLLEDYVCVGTSPPAGRRMHHLFVAAYRPQAGAPAARKTPRKTAGKARRSGAPRD